MKKILFAILFLLFTLSFSAPVTIIDNSSDIKTICREEIRSLYLMKRKRTYEGETVYLFQFPTQSNAHKEFILKNLQMSIEEYTRELNKALNAGNGKPIKIVKTNEEMFRSVSSTYNGVGYIDENTLIINSGDYYVKILRITD